MNKSLLLGAALVALSLTGLRCKNDSPEREVTGQKEKVPAASRTQAGKSLESAANPGDPKPATADPDGASALKDVSSPIARRYLSFLTAKNGRLARESHAGSIVNNAFKQAWVLTARMELTEAQQDRLAEFLLEQDWLSWSSMPPARIEKWAKQNLTSEQQATLKEFLAEQKEGAENLEELKRVIQKVEHGGKSQVEIFAAEMAALKAYFSDSTQSPASPPPAFDPTKQKQFATLVETEQAFRFYNLLADRIPLTASQHEAVYAALRSGAKPPVNPYDYQSLTPERAGASVRAKTEWLGSLLTPSQYETYVRHFLAEIEMVRFQNR